MEEVISIIEKVLVAVTPIIVAYLTYRTNKKSKEDKEYRELREKYEEEIRVNQEKKRQERDEELDKKFSGLKEDLNKVQTELKEFDTKAITKQLDDLVEISEINLEYSQSLSKVVVTIGEAIRDSDIIESCDISDAIREHQDNERKITNKLYKVLY